VLTGREKRTGLVWGDGRQRVQALIERHEPLIEFTLRAATMICEDVAINHARPDVHFAPRLWRGRNAAPEDTPSRI
jgi:hypothetical protein